VGSGCTDLAAFNKAMGDAKTVLQHVQSEPKYAASYAKSMYLIDIGGGYPGDAQHPSFKGMVDNILRNVADINSMSQTKLQFIAEPGRYFAHGSTSLLTKVIGKNEVEAEDENGVMVDKFRYFLTDGVYGSFNNIVYDHAKVSCPAVVHVSSLPGGGSSSGKVETAEAQAAGENETKMCRSMLFGPTCDGFDLIGEFPLPELEEEVSYLLWEGMGAYTQAAASRFNGMPLPKKWYYSVSEPYTGATPSTSSSASHSKNKTVTLD